MFCSNCGKETDNNSNFCNNCGLQFVKIKKSSLFDFKQEQSGKNVFIYYILMNLVNIAFGIVILPFIFQSGNTNSFSDGFNVGQTISVVTTPIFGLLFSMIFFVPKKLYKNPIAYIFTILGMILPPFIGYVFIAFLAIFKNE